MRLFCSEKKNTGLSAEPAHPFVTAVIVAAGNSTRMGGVNKQKLRIDGVPVLIRTLRTFSESPWIDEIVVATREQDISDLFAAVKAYEIRKVTDIVKGGATIGLIKAINTFNPDKKIKLATYASRCIENEILMYLRRNSKTRMEVSIDEPLNVDWDGNELLLSDILGTDDDVISKDLDQRLQGGNI